MFNIEKVFSFHPGNAVTGPKHDALRSLLKGTAEQLALIVPDSAEKTLMLRKLQEAMFYGNAAIALHTPSNPT